MIGGKAMKIRIIPTGEEIMVDGMAENDVIALTKNNARKLLKELKCMYESVMPEGVIIAYRMTNGYTESPKKVIA